MFEFISQLQTDPQYYLSIVVGVVISIVLHELAHGWMAIKKGDHTPISSGHMTGNPLVHMGPFSILMLLFIGIAWGQMPIDPTRLRGKYAQAMVAIAGPAVNLIIAFIVLTAIGLAWRLHVIDPGVAFHNSLVLFFYRLGLLNVLLCIFNLMPVPPLDGAHVLANFSRGYNNLLGDPTKQGLWLLAFMFAFMFANVIYSPFVVQAQHYLLWLADDVRFDLYLMELLS